MRFVSAHSLIPAPGRPPESNRSAMTSLRRLRSSCGRHQCKRGCHHRYRQQEVGNPIGVHGCASGARIRCAGRRRSERRGGTARSWQTIRSSSIVSLASSAGQFTDAAKRAAKSKGASHSRHHLRSRGLESVRARHPHPEFCLMGDYLRATPSLGSRNRRTRRTAQSEVHAATTSQL